ncbi:carbohydrate ABC transporter substrate-binding protein, CUT1 family [Alkalispirochaeta americana]|uniref:Carbohydrate ABC transporter substrate-binding protein, CUT1 family n=1 Tax=Alkalispirochaeta americana TaxID=159291 RepID=A0A1N6SK90_9SPIO|nr:ABC transporter substrate-binding protein [Alkalispirochaeta americana]SIQ41565.1 carbohydrate ABC transporter substrate-binding protein, CUT1 family [Alkalispirochaeta americana]
MKKQTAPAVLAVLCVAAFCATVLFSGCSKDDGREHVTLMQNKPEIDAMLQRYGSDWSQRTGIGVTIKSVGGGTGATLGQQLRADYAAGEMPDIFIIAGPEDYREWESLILDLSDEPWVADTSLAFTLEGRVYGFPVALEGWGMAYNADLLQKAGIDPRELVNYDAYRRAFQRLDSMKSELGIDSVVSMAASADMGWVTAHHNFNSLLSNGLPYGDFSVVEDLLNGQVDQQLLEEYADWVELLFQYADRTVLTTGNYDTQVGAFATGRAAFLHQGNWVDPNLESAGAEFPRAFAPHGSQHSDTEGIFVSAPSFYVVNAESPNIEAAKQFLRDKVYTDQGQQFMVEEAGMIPAFSNIERSPAGQLSQSVQEWAARDKVFSWNQYHFSNDFRDQSLAPIYNRFATGQINRDEFVRQLTWTFETREP